MSCYLLVELLIADGTPLLRWPCIKTALNGIKRDATVFEKGILRIEALLFYILLVINEQV